MWSFPNAGVSTSGTIPAIRNLVALQNPDVVVTHSVKSHFLLWRSRVWRDYPWVAFHHGYTTTDLKMRAYNRLDRWSLPAADRLVTVCEALRGNLRGLRAWRSRRSPCSTIPVRPKPEATAAEVRDLRTRLGIANGERIVLTIGRLSREKAHIDLLAAYKLLQDTNPTISSKLIIAGDGPERRPLESAVAAQGLKDRVIFTGQLSDVRVVYGAADVFALPSHSEGSPNVLLEAMAARLPVVATAVGGVPEVVQDGGDRAVGSAGGPRQVGNGDSACVNRPGSRPAVNH